MTAPRLAVLGGSTPFTAALVEALAGAASALPAFELVLFGRDAAALGRVGGYARRRLAPWGWRVSTATRLDDAAAGAAFVLNQVRHGGMEMRRAGEAFCARFGVPADETLGPAALRTALATRGAVAATAERLVALSPGAWVLNLVNPLSVTTAAMARHLPRCIGLCELPGRTAALAAAARGVAIVDTEWAYGGLNHRGFVHSLRAGGRDLVAEVAGGGEAIGGVAPARIAALGAIPLKYDRLLAPGAPLPPPRAGFLAALRERLLAELAEGAPVPPPSLARRDTGWYAEAVVPALRALCGEAMGEMVFDLPGTDGVIEEVKGTLGPGGWRVSPAPPLPPAAAALDARYRAHERAVLRAVSAPSREEVAAALRADPTVPPELAEPVAAALWREVEPLCMEMAG